MSDLPRVDINQPKWDQSVYSGRVKHFFMTANPINLFASSRKLDAAKDIVDKYRAGKSLPPGTTIDDVWRAKQLYDSAFHPDTGEKMFILGRMSAQVPCNMSINAGMMTFYKTTAGVVLWQWINQSLNATVNYTNRSGDSPISLEQLGCSYLLATTGAVVTALTLNKQVTRFPPLIGRLVPFAAVASANCINIPIMRSKEIMNGVPVVDSNNNRIGLSKTAAKEGIILVLISRVVMAIPPLVIPPIIIDNMDKKGVFIKYPNMLTPMYLVLGGVLLTFATPMCCALFDQRVAISVSRLEAQLQEAAKKHNLSPNDKVFYNKGL